MIELRLIEGLLINENLDRNGKKKKKSTRGDRTTDFSFLRRVLYHCATTDPQCLNNYEMLEIL